VLAALVDTGPIVAMFARSEPDASHYRKLFTLAAKEHWALATCWPCVVEASHMLAPPQRYAMLRWAASGAVTVFPIEAEQLEGTVELMKQWTEPPRTEMDLADAELVRLANEMGVTRIMTTDRRDFSRYRLADGSAFEIL
jgi:uncharacterized protein